MILVDTSVWIDHLRSKESLLSNVLEGGEVMTHPFVVGELACGNLKDRQKVLGLLSNLPETLVATEPEVLQFIELRNLMGRGIGYIDVHLLASVVLDGTAQLWTRDKNLATAARELDLAFEEGV